MYHVQSYHLAQRHNAQNNGCIQSKRLSICMAKFHQRRISWGLLGTLFWPILNNHQAALSQYSLETVKSHPDNQYHLCLCNSVGRVIPS